MILSCVMKSCAILFHPPAPYTWEANYHFIQYIFGVYTTHWLEKKSSIHKVWYYLWFQALTVGLGRYRCE